MKVWLLVLALVGVVCLHGKSVKSKETEGPIEVLPTFVVIGTRIPSSWLEIAWECRGPMPIDHIKRAWVSKVQPDSPAALAGFKVGDALLAIGETSVETMTGVSLQLNLKRERAVGTRETFTLQTPGKEKKTVVMVFEKK